MAYNFFLYRSEIIVIISNRYPVFVRFLQSTSFKIRIYARLCFNRFITVLLFAHRHLPDRFSGITTQRYEWIQIHLSTIRRRIVRRNRFLFETSNSIRIFSRFRRYILYSQRKNIIFCMNFNVLHPQFPCTVT